MRTPAFVAALLGLASGAACGGVEREGRPGEAPSARGATAEVAELEIHPGGLDRFVRCPPPGALGQHWIPPIPAWAAEARAAGSAPSPSPPSSLDPTEGRPVARTRDRTLGEEAIAATHRDFRSCFRKSLLRDPAQDGRVAVVLRVGADGTVAQVESYAACELSSEALACMKQVATRLRFDAPTSGAETLTIPVAFTSRDGVRKTVASDDDAYTASAFLAVESTRPALHACEDAARRAHGAIEASGSFTVSVGSDGRVAHVHVDPWRGERGMLVCAAAALERVAFPPPPGGKGTVLARINFNPRQGSR